MSVTSHIMVLYKSTNLTPINTATTTPYHKHQVRENHKISDDSTACVLCIMLTLQCHSGLSN